MWLLPALLLGQFALCELSITFPNATDGNELVRIHDYYQPSPLVDSVANLGIHAVIDLLSSHPNVIISPLNIFSCLDILELGAAGATKEEIDNIVGHAKSDNTLGKILKTLHGTTHASAVFFNQELVPKAEFIQESYSKHQTEILNLDFSDGAQATSAINSWVFYKTNGTIQEILDQNVDANAKVVVVNALTFNGKWLHPFSPYVTETGRFDIDDQHFVNIPLMHLEAYLPVIRRTTYDAVGLPYQEENLVMYVILPNNQGLEELKKVLYSFSPTDLKGFTSSAIPQMASIVLPKFKLTARFSMKEALAKQGMNTSFNPELGNFTNFLENEADDVYISDIYHSVHFEVNEHETIASAASAAIFTKSRTFQFKVTRPFIFVIADKSGLLLFMGVVNKPE
ncbi:UNVERIFIED_CONTAM: hypothetical protein PYX00_005528 [Menopon gallinae]|uniref:Serpin domain-containing protein n=1 Tax=Menopon gallinae TaxID=328185 RepID=A0AAW2HS21_9NEOP